MFGDEWPRERMFPNTTVSDRDAPVNDINEGVQRVRGLGGSAEDPGAIPQKGWYARCSDTEGNQFGLWQNDPNAPMADGTPNA